jgi:hypothetical protein
MPTNYLFKLLVALALVIVVALTVREALATAALTSGTHSVPCSSLPSRHSIRTERVEETGMSIIRTEDGPTGVDDGLVELLSSYHTCLR